MKGGAVKRRRNSTGKKTVKRRKITQKAKRRSAKAATSSQYLTDQFDKRVDYVAVKKSNKNVKRDIEFRNKVVKALTPTLPTVTKIKRVNVTSFAISTPASEQQYLIFHMRPQNSTNVLNIEPAQDDLADISSELAATKGAITDSELSPSYWVISSVMDIDVEPVGSGDSVIDVYEIVYQKKAGDPTDQYVSFNAALTDANILGQGMGTTLSMTSRGVTPFDITGLIRNLGAKVVKKSSSLLTAGAGGFTYTVKDYRKQLYNPQNITGDTFSSFCLQGWTKTVLMVQRALVSDGGGTQFRAVATKHYRVRPISNEQSTANWTGIN